MDEVPVAQVATYAAEDADVPLRLQPLLAPRLDEMGLDEAERDGRSAADRRAWPTWNSTASASSRRGWPS